MIFDKLRERTAENHRMVEESGLMLPISSQTVTVEQYRKIITTFYGFFHPLEKKIDAIDKLEQFLPDLPERRKSSSLLDDICYFNRQSTSAKDLSCCADLPEIRTVAEAFGALYVMEGSSLGAKVISGILKDRLQLEKATGASFFNAYGEHTSSKWKSFKEHLNNYVSSDSEQENQVIETADLTFKKFYQWITQ